MAYDPDPPTRRIPARPGGPPPGPPVDDAWHEHLLDQVRSLRTALAVVGVLAAASLGVAVFALLRAGGDDGATGASAERVGRVSDRVDALEERLDARATKGDLEDVRGELSALEDRVEKAEGDDPAEAVEGVREDVEALEDRVDALESRQPPPPGQDGSGEAPAP